MDHTAVFRHARELQQARSLGELAAVAHGAVQSLTRFRHSWLGLLEPANPGFMRIVEASSAIADLVAEQSPTVPIAGDQMMEELLRNEAVIVVVDARTDPRTNKDLVGRLQNRTIINVPMVLGSQVLGTLGFGSFGDEGCLAPTPAELDALVVFSTQLAAAFERVRAHEQQQRDERERAGIERRLESLQRLELMGVLASGVAHDLNNLLTVVQANLEVLGEGHDPEAHRDATTAVVRAGDICRQLLTLGRTHAARRERLDLNERVDATLRLVRPAIPRGVVVHHAPVARPMVDVDPVQVDQALANLVLNARDAVGGHGTIDVTVEQVTFDASVTSLARWARPGNFARVSVRDSGTGVPAALLERIFDPLFTTKSNGTGLGLAVVSRVVQQHEGLLHCESQPGRTCFEVYLPVSA